MAGTIAEVRGVTTSYPMGDVTANALRGAELALASGERVVLLGPSGSGRSTLHDILGGLDIPATGRALYRDTDITTASGKAAGGKILTHYSRESVGCVFQSFNLVRTLTARENAALVTVLDARLFRPQDALELLGLGCRLNLFPAPLSDGEQQRVAIACAAAKRPAIPLRDEPASALDAAGGTLVLGAIARADREPGTTTAVITHNAAIAVMADGVLHLADERTTEGRRNECRRAPEALRW